MRSQNIKYKYATQLYCIPTLSVNWYCIYNKQTHKAEIDDHTVVKTGQRHCLTELAYLKGTVDFQWSSLFLHFWVKNNKIVATSSQLDIHREQVCFSGRGVLVKGEDDM